ncbi:MAG: plasmid pRiA4b ORF-3 family protein [Chitinophagaceae bacterium]|nr:plasmid pRiA4b ORF-3 family protein [Chitinophagaceae bacterium]
MVGLQFYIELIDSRPYVWRRIVVPHDYTFYKFHLAIQGAFGWENCHLFHFSENGFLDKVCYAEIINDGNTAHDLVTKDARRSKIKLVFVKQNDFVYIYDFGDNWKHRVVFERVVEEEIERPYCVAGGGACPPEDCGGLGGYAAMLKIFNTKDHPEQAEYSEWLGLVPGEKWDADFCSIREVNKRLCLLE